MATNPYEYQASQLFIKLAPQDFMIDHETNQSPTVIATDLLGKMAP